jgi:geranylgeranyl pyrophosphate synthase
LNKKVSVIVPIYNVEKYLEKCLISITHQSYKDIEIILVNDGSTDGSLSICQKYEKIDTRIHLINKSNGGLSSARNAGIDFSSGEYLVFIDSDDFIHLKMIEYKTAVLVGAAMQMGAIVANASADDQQHIYNFGKNLGIAFQLQDDYLDAFGDPETFGKQVGGDIIENKKTYLYLKTLEFSDADEQDQLQHLFSINPTETADKIETVKQLYISSGAAEATKTEIENYTNKAFSVLEHLQISEDKKMVLRLFGEQLMTRNV